MVTRSINHVLLHAFFLLVFIIHYQTILIPGTLPAWMLFLGCLTTIPVIVQKCIQSGYRLPTDYALILFMAMMLVLGFVINFRDAQLISLQAYLISFVTYVFVREHMPGISLQYFYRLNTAFLIGNSALMIAQFLTGGFFVARFIAAGDPPLAWPSGFADGPTKNGMIHAAALSLVFARVALLRVPILSLDVLALLMGGLCLLLTISRSGVAGFAIAAVCTVILAASNRSGTQARPRQLLAALGALIVAGVTVYVSMLYLSAGRVDSVVGRRTAGVIDYKFALNETETGSFQDPSLNTRIATTRAAGTFLMAHPLKMLFGAGMGAFQGIYEQIAPSLDNTGVIIMSEISSHNSYIEFFIEGGGIVFCAWLYLIVHVVRKVMARPDGITAVPVLISLISTMGFMLFHDVLRGRMFWMPLGILGSIAYAESSLLDGVRSRPPVSPGQDAT